jgi:hypothetical protein
MNDHHDWEEDWGLLEWLDHPEGDEAGDLDYSEEVDPRQRHLKRRHFISSLLTNVKPWKTGSKAQTTE